MKHIHLKIEREDPFAMPAKDQAKVAQAISTGTTPRAAECHDCHMRNGLHLDTCRNLLPRPEKTRSSDIAHTPDLLMPDENIANARLIAAAPSLLEACEQAEYWLKAERDRDASVESGATEPDMILKVLRAAIAKATA